MARTNAARAAANQDLSEAPPTLPPVEERPEPTLNRTPAFKTRYGRVEAAVWDRELDEGRKVYSVTLQRSYQDKEGQWHRTSSLDENDLLPAAKALDECYVFIQKDRHAQHGNGH